MYFSGYLLADLIDYARLLLIYGEKDARVKRFEVDRIFENLHGEKELLIFPDAGHGDYLDKDQEKWEGNIRVFLQENL